MDVFFLLAVGLGVAMLVVGGIRRRSARTASERLDAALDIPVPPDRLRVQIPAWDAPLDPARSDLSPTSLAGRMARRAAEQPGQESPPESSPESADADELLDLVAMDAEPPAPIQRHRAPREVSSPHDLGTELLASLDAMLTEAAQLAAPWNRSPSSATGPPPRPRGDGRIGPTTEWA